MLIMKNDDMFRDQSFIKLIYTILLLVLPNMLITLFRSHRDEDTGAIRQIRQLFTKKRTLFKVLTKIHYKNNILWSKDVPQVFKAIMSDMCNKLTKDNTNNVPFTIQEVFLGHTTMKIIMFENSKYKYSPETDVYVKLDFDSKISENGESSYHTYILKVFSNNNNYEKIENYVKKCIDQYQVEQLKQLETQHIFVLSSINKETNVAEFQDITFDTTKSFDNMFFEGKDDLKQRIDYFVNNKDNYKRLGIPYTFGMMFYGTPGTGKTSAIKAVAKYTNRHIIVIPIKKVKSIEVLKGIFLNKEINGVHVDNNKRLYVFEEIDCGQWQHIVLSRKPHTKTDKEICMQDALIKAINTIKVAKDKEEDDNKLDQVINLGDFLELLDGIVEIPGRMIIMTSNHPEMLDSALIRPGRIDKVIEFKKMTRQDIINMYKLWFNKMIPSHICEKIKDYKFTQAEIGNIFALQDSALIFNELTLPREL